MFSDNFATFDLFFTLLLKHIEVGLNIEMSSSDIFLCFQPEDDVMKSLTILNPKNISSTQRHNPRYLEYLVSRYESLIEYQRRIATRL